MMCLRSKSGSSKGDQSESRSVMSDSLRPHGLQSPRNSPGQNTEVGSHFPLQGIFPTQGLNPGVPHCKQILYQLSHQGSPRILEWVACPFSSRSSRPRNQTGLSCIAGGFFTRWTTREAQRWWEVVIHALTDIFSGRLEVGYDAKREVKVDWIFYISITRRRKFYLLR